MAAVYQRRAPITLPGGFGAGVGASIAMMLVMAILRFTTNTVSIPELLEESLIRITGGPVEAFFINKLGVGGKALLLVTMVEGTLILGGLLGLAFTRLWPLRSPSMRWLSGLSYGIVIGLLLNVVLLPLVNQGFFGSNALQVTAPPDIARALYGTTLAPFGVPVAISMFILSIVFGLTLVALLPWRVTSQATQPAAAADGAMGRRDFNKAMGGAALALVGGVGLWFVIRSALAPPPNAGPVAVEDPGTGASGGTATPPPVAQPSPESTHIAETNATPDMTEVAATPPVPPGFENVKPGARPRGHSGR